MSSIHVTINFRDDTTKRYDCTDIPSVGGDWITIYRNLRRTMIPAQAVKSIDYDFKA